MAQSLDDLPIRAALVEVARDFHARGWMPGTAGNVSARADASHFWITGSGLPKGRLGEEDFLLVRIADGIVVEQGRPALRASAETAIHAALYGLDPAVGACLHGHTVVASLATARLKPAAMALKLPALEMVKGFDVWDERPKAELVIFQNHLKVERIADDVRRRFGAGPPRVSALLVRDHGPTVWGASVQQAYDRFESLDFLLTYLAQRRA